MQRISKTNTKLEQSLSATRNDFSATKNDLTATRNDLSATKNDLIATQNELSATKDHLSSTRTELRETNSKLEKAVTELLQLKKNFSTCSTPTQQSATPQATKPRPNPTSAPPNKVEEIIPLMEEVVRPNQPGATQSIYCNNVKRMSKLMTIGQLYYLNEKECFFKLRLQQNYRTLFIRLVKDLADYRNNKNNEFENEDIVLWDSSSWYYALYVSIRKHDVNNSKGFMIDTKRSENNRLLKYGYNDNNGLNDYKDSNDCVFFLFNKEMKRCFLLFVHDDLFDNFLFFDIN